MGIGMGGESIFPYGLARLVTGKQGLCYRSNAAFQCSNFKVISNALLDDRDVAEAAAANFGFVDLSDFLKHLSPRLKDDKTFAQLAVKVDPMYLAYVSDRLKDDKEIVLEAVNQHPSVMKFASARLKDDLDVVQVANRYRGSFTDFHTFWDGGPSFEFVSDRLKDDKNMALQAVSAYPRHLSLYQIA